MNWALTRSSHVNQVATSTIKRSCNLDFSQGLASRIYPNKLTTKTRANDSVLMTEYVALHRFMPHRQRGLRSMREREFTITYPEGEAQQLHQALLLLKRSRCLNISAFCREAIAEKLERLETVK